MTSKSLTLFDLAFDTQEVRRSTFSLDRLRFRVWLSLEDPGVGEPSTIREPRRDSGIHSRCGRAVRTQKSNLFISEDLDCFQTLKRS